MRGCEDPAVTVHQIDLLYRGAPGGIATYLVDTDDGPAIVDSGPASCRPALEAGLAAHGLRLRDLRHLLLTHIHLDHAGAAGTLVRLNPRLQVHVSEIGAPHVLDPSRLERSARRLYLDAFDTLFGELAPVPEQNLHVVGDGVLGLECFRTPGHASHHVSYLGGDGTLFAGDVLGVRVVPGRYIIPAAPPPDITLEGWDESLRAIEERAPERAALAHFGIVEDVEDHVDRLRETLARWAGWVDAGLDEESFVRRGRAELDAAEGEAADAYISSGNLSLSFAGLRRYFDKKAEAAGAG